MHYQLPIKMVNTGSDFYYPDKKNKTHTADDNDTDRDGDKDKKQSNGTLSLVDGPDCKCAASNCTNKLLSGDSHTSNTSDIKEPCTLPSELPSQRSFSETWQIYGLYAPVPVQAFDIEQLGCPIALTPPFPPLSLGYSSSVVVSSSLTTQVYAYTEYVDFRFGQRVDGRFHGRDSIEVTHNSGLSVLYDNPLLDEAAYGYGSREDYSHSSDIGFVHSIA